MLDYLHCSEMSQSLTFQNNVTLPYSFPSVQIAARNLGAVFTSHPILQTMMHTISDEMAQRSSNTTFRSLINKARITQGSVGINDDFSAKTLFIPPSSRLYTYLKFSCSTRGNIFTQWSYFFATSLFWAAPKASDPLTIDFKVSKHPIHVASEKELLHIHCETDGLPKLICTSSLTSNMRKIHSDNSPLKTPRQEKFIILDRSDSEKPLDIILIKTLIKSVLKSLKEKSLSPTIEQK